MRFFEDFFLDSELNYCERRIQRFLSPLHSQKRLDIPECLRELRGQRMHLVQMVGQYKFVYTSIIQYIKRARLI